MMIRPEGGQPDGLVISWRQTGTRPAMMMMMMHLDGPFARTVSQVQLELPVRITHTKKEFRRTVPSGIRKGSSYR